MIRGPYLVTRRLTLDFKPVWKALTFTENSKKSIFFPELILRLRFAITATFVGNFQIVMVLIRATHQVDRGSIHFKMLFCKTTLRIQCLPHYKSVWKYVIFNVHITSWCRRYARHTFLYCFLDCVEWWITFLIITSNIRFLLLL